MNAVTTPVLHPSSAAVDSPSAGSAGMDSAERIMVTAALAGDDEAFETVIRTYSRRVYAGERRDDACPPSFVRRRGCSIRGPRHGIRGANHGHRRAGRRRRGL